MNLTTINQTINLFIATSSYDCRTTLRTRALPCGAIQQCDLRLTYVIRGYNGRQKSTTCYVLGLSRRTALVIASCKSGGMVRLKKSVLHALPHILGHYMPYIMNTHFIMRVKAHLRASHILAYLKAHLTMISLVTHHHEQIKVGYKVLRLIQRATSLPDMRRRLRSEDYRRELRELLRREPWNFQMGNLRLDGQQRDLHRRSHGSGHFAILLEHAAKVREWRRRRNRMASDENNNTNRVIYNYFRRRVGTAVHNAHNRASSSNDAVASIANVASNVTSAPSQIADIASSDIASVASDVATVASADIGSVTSEIARIASETVQATSSSSRRRFNWMARLCQWWCGDSLKRI